MNEADPPPAEEIDSHELEILIAEGPIPRIPVDANNVHLVQVRHDFINN
jgi:hypothetical protein